MVAELLRAENTMALATAGRDGRVSVAPLYYIADDDLNFYWLSSARSEHGKNMQRCTQAAATVYRHSERWKQIRGVQMRGEVKQVETAALRAGVLEDYCEKFKLGAALRLAARQSAMYSMRPHWFRYIDNARRFGYRFELER